MILPSYTSDDTLTVASGAAASTVGLKALLQKTRAALQEQADDGEAWSELWSLREAVELEGFATETVLRNVTVLEGLLGSREDVAEAIVVLNKIWACVTAVDLHQVMRHVADSSNPSLEGENCVMMLGLTGSGKTTITHYLCGSKIVIDKTSYELVVRPTASELQDFKVAARGSTISVTTRMRTVRQKGTLFVDTVGYGDMRGSEVRIAESVLMSRALASCKSVRLVVVLNVAFGTKMQDLRKCIEVFAGALCPGSLTRILQCVTFIFTKSTDSIPEREYNRLFDEVNGAMQANGTTAAQHQVYEELVSQLKSGTALLVKPNEGTPSPAELIEMIMSKPPVTEPQKAFVTSICEGSVKEVKRQIGMDKEAIGRLLLSNGNPERIADILSLHHDLCAMVSVDELTTTAEDCAKGTRDLLNDRVKQVAMRCSAYFVFDGEVCLEDEEGALLRDLSEVYTHLERLKTVFERLTFLGVDWAAVSLEQVCKEFCNRFRGKEVTIVKIGLSKLHMACCLGEIPKTHYRQEVLLMREEFDEARKEIVRMMEASDAGCMKKKIDRCGKLVECLPHLDSELQYLLREVHDDATLKLKDLEDCVTQLPEKNEEFQSLTKYLKDLEKLPSISDFSLGKVIAPRLDVISKSLEAIFCESILTKQRGMHHEVLAAQHTMDAIACNPLARNFSKKQDQSEMEVNERARRQITNYLHGEIQEVGDSAGDLCQLARCLKRIRNIALRKLDEELAEGCFLGVSVNKHSNQLMHKLYFLRNCLSPLEGLRDGAFLREVTRRLQQAEDVNNRICGGFMSEWARIQKSSILRNNRVASVAELVDKLKFYDNKIRELKRKTGRVSEDYKRLSSFTRQELDAYRSINPPDCKLSIVAPEEMAAAKKAVYEKALPYLGEMGRWGVISPSGESLLASLRASIFDEGKKQVDECMECVKAVRKKLASATCDAGCTWDLGDVSSYTTPIVELFQGCNTAKRGPCFIEQLPETESVSRAVVGLFDLIRGELTEKTGNDHARVYTLCMKLEGLDCALGNESVQKKFSTLVDKYRAGVLSWLSYNITGITRKTLLDLEGVMLRLKHLGNTFDALKKADDLRNEVTGHLCEQLAQQQESASNVLQAKNMLQKVLQLSVRTRESKTLELGDKHRNTVFEEEKELRGLVSKEVQKILGRLERLMNTKDPNAQALFDDTCDNVVYSIVNLDTQRSIDLYRAKHEGKSEKYREIIAKCVEKWTTTDCRTFKTFVNNGKVDDDIVQEIKCRVESTLSVQVREVTPECASSTRNLMDNMSLMFPDLVAKYEELFADTLSTQHVNFENWVKSCVTEEMYDLLEKRESQGTRVQSQALYKQHAQTALAQLNNHSWNEENFRRAFEMCKRLSDTTPEHMQLNRYVNRIVSGDCAETIGKIACLILKENCRYWNNTSLITDIEKKLCTCTAEGQSLCTSFHTALQKGDFKVVWEFFTQFAEWDVKARHWDPVSQLLNGSSISSSFPPRDERAKLISGNINKHINITKQLGVGNLSRDDSVSRRRYFDELSKALSALETVPEVVCNDLQIPFFDPTSSLKAAVAEMVKKGSDALKTSKPDWSIVNSVLGNLAKLAACKITALKDISRCEEHRLKQEVEVLIQNIETDCRSANRTTMINGLIKMQLVRENCDMGNAAKGKITAALADYCKRKGAIEMHSLAADLSNLHQQANLVKEQHIFGDYQRYSFNTATAKVTFPRVKETLKEQNEWDDKLETVHEGIVKMHMKLVFDHLQECPSYKKLVAATKQAGKDLSNETFSTTGRVKNFLYLGDRLSTLAKLLAHIFALWTLQVHDGSHKDEKYLLKPHTVQILAILCALGVRDGSILKGHIVKVGTGEGKSVVLAVLGVVCNMIGLEPYIACCYKYLSQRDKEDFAPLYEALGVTVTYGTFQDLCEGVLGADDLRASTHDLVVQGNALKPKRPPTTTRCLLVDEADVFASSYYASLFRPATLIKNPHLKSLTDYMWVAKPTLLSVTNRPEYKSAVECFSDCSRDLFQEAVKDMLFDLRAYKSHTWVVNEKKWEEENVIQIGYKSHDTVCYTTIYGYKTMWASYEEHHNRIEDVKERASKLSDKVYFRVNCGAYSYSEILSSFDFVLGVSGTLPRENTFQHEVMTKKLGVKQMTHMPSMYGKCKRKFSPAVDVTMCYEEQFEDILVNEIKKGRDEGKRAVVVFFKEELQLNRVMTSINNNYTHGIEVGQRILEDNTLKERNRFISKATDRGMVTFATQPFARGTDFKITDERVDNAGGLAVIETYVGSEADHIQCKGRAARQGQNGSFSMVIVEESLTELGFKKGEAAIANEEGKLYEALVKKRNAYYDGKGKQLKEEALKCRDAHKKSMEFRDMLDRSKVNDAMRYLLEWN
eukprot:TRINITY_DN5516_c0_g1_i1.p1 TRINITY_DN5516_c0_g1~~TRINITY_DN5516_c0_g1_i1.p1  ORF type:complete len:2378 (+),score=409.72 TRINITY_DN5516_c0_g1_i1:85-7218(+)